MPRPGDTQREKEKEKEKGAICRVALL